MSRPRKKDTHLPKCVYIKHGAYWYVKGGEWTRLPAEGPSTLQSALEAYAAIIETPQGTMSAHVDDALKWLRKRKPPLSKSTITQYEQAAKILKRKLVQFRPEQVLPKHIAGIKISMASTPNMANRVLSFTRQVFDYLLEQQLVPSNPAVGIKRYKENKRTQMPTTDQHDLILQHSGARLRVILDLLRYAGQRIVDTLRIENADCADDLPGIRFDPQKTGKPFYAKWTPELRDTVARARALRGNVRSLRWLLPGHGNKPPDYRTVKDQFDKACEAAGIQGLTLHDWRAMALTRAKKEGLDPQALGRHSTPQNTERYLRDRDVPVVETPRFRRLIDSES
jgi:integrase